MNHRWLCLLLAIGAAVALPGAATGQQQQSAHPRTAAQGLPQPQLRDDEVISPSQIVRPPAVTQSVPAKPAPAAKPPEPAHAVACSGTFSKDSAHLKLTQAFGAHNVEFTQVSGADGATMMASVLFPKDPKRRLEVLWDDDTTKAGTRLIVITGQSTWTAQKGLHLGLPMAALEKLNGKPFKVTGFDHNGESLVSDWNGGMLSLLPDGCKLGIQFKPDPKATADARGAVTGDKEFTSTDAAIRAVKPIVDEIILAY
jgi:hypothetical protein